MKIFSMICLLVLLSVGFIDIVDVFTNFAEKSKREWLRTSFMILQMVGFVAFLCVAIIGIITLL